MIERTVLYARISIATEESVSIARQLASGRKYAAARGWEIVGEYVDEGVSATLNKPEQRAAWQALLGTETAFEAVIVWKVDRLVRRVTDFLQVDEVLQARGAALVCVEQSIDMTTGEGRAFAQMLAVFGEMEAAAISARRRAAREHLIATGRSTGGRPPYGWQFVRPPDGPGKVRVQDPERIDWLREMVVRALRGDTVYSIAKWLEEVEAPGPRGGKGKTDWCYSNVDRILRNPALAGMTSHNPGNTTGSKRGPEVLRGEDGNPVISPDGILTVEEFERLQFVITHKEHPSAVPRALRRSTSPIIAQIATCAHCDVVLARVTNGPRMALGCRSCGQCIAYFVLARHLEERLLKERGDLPVYVRTWIIPGDPLGSRRLADIDHQLRTAALALTMDNADAGSLGKELIRLKQERARARRRTGRPAAEVLVDTGRTLRDMWLLCTTDEQRRELLVSQIETLDISRGKQHSGRYMNLDRINLVWVDKTKKTVAPLDISPYSVHTQSYEPAPWISRPAAAALVGCSEGTISNAVASGLITRRKIGSALPSLSRASVERFALVWQEMHRNRPQSGTKHLRRRPPRPRTNKRAGGRRTVMTPDRVAAAQRMRADGMTIADIADNLGVGASSVSRALWANQDELTATDP